MTNGSDKMSIEEQIASVVSTYEDPIYPVDAVDVFTPQKRVLSAPLDVTGLFYNEAHLAAYVNNTIENLKIEDVPNEEDLKYLQSLQGRAYAGQTVVQSDGGVAKIFVVDYVGDESNGYQGSYHRFVDQYYGSELYASIGVKDDIINSVSSMISDAIDNFSATYASIGQVNALESRVSALENGSGGGSGSVTTIMAVSAN